MGSVGMAEKADRLSSLPLPLLHRILSFLPTRDVVQTCLLSRRWQDLWTSIPDLYFQAFHELDHIQTPFPVFVDEVLVRRDASHLRKFRLDLDPHDWDATCARKWVCYAVKHAVEKIEIHWSENSCPQYCSPRRQLFACESLVYLNLDADVDVDVGGGYLQLCNTATCAIDLPNLQSLKLTSFEITSICFQQLLCCSPKLKILNLRQCHLPDTQVFDVSCCSCLESLSIRESRLPGIKTINASAPKLKSFTIKASSPEPLCRVSVMKISAPNLLHLEYYYYVVKELCIDNLPKLLDAVVGWDLYGSITDDRAVQSGLEFLKGLVHVRKLRLYNSFLKILSRVTDLWMHLPFFTNLKFLKVVINKVNIDELKAFVCLLKLCHSIETLVIMMKDCDNGGSWESDYFPYECQLYNLKEIEIKLFEGSDMELHLMKLLLKSAMVLEKMFITAPKLDLQERQEICLKLLTYPRVSSKMSILFS